MAVPVEYSLAGGVSGYHIDNGFTRYLSKVCTDFGSKLQPFNVLIKKDMKKFNVSDIAFLSGISHELTATYGGLLLCQEAAIVRAEMLRERGVHVPLNESDAMTSLFYDYLLSCCVCYVEIESDSMKMQKFLATKNLRVLSELTNIPVKDLQVKYGSRMETTAVELRGGMLRYLEVSYRRGVMNVVAPRQPINKNEIRVIPLFCMTAFLVGLEPYLKSSIIEFDYFKDNKDVRTLATTLNRNIMMDYYKDSSYVDHVLNTSLLYDQYNKIDKMLNIPISAKVNRGYIKVPELGSSRYDGSGTRSLNFARLLQIRVAKEVDRTFIDVDLGLTLDAFVEGVFQLVTRPSDILQVYYDFAGADADVNHPMITIANIIKTRAEQTYNFGTTVFLRWLHVYMIERPEFFPNYTGKPVSGVATSVQSFGIVESDF